MIQSMKTKMCRSCQAYLFKASSHRLTRDKYETVSNADCTRCRYYENSYQKENGLIRAAGYRAPASDREKTLTLLAKVRGW